MEEAQIEFDKFVVPESRNIPRSSIGNDGKVDLKKPHAPLLIIAGGKDNIVPASLNLKNYKAYTDTNSQTDFKEFAGRTHYTCAQPNWEEVALYINDWISQLGK